MGLPYVFAKYTGALPARSGLPVDNCKCWHSAFQDFSLSARYRLGDEIWALTPTIRYDIPSHDYAFRGEAVVGRNLQEVQLGLNAGLRLVVLPKANVQAGYTYAVVERALKDISINRSNGYFDFGYGLTRSLQLRGTMAWQRMHGGLRAGSITGNPFPFPGELNTQERQIQGDRLIRSNYIHAGGGLSYSLSTVDVFASVRKYVWGRDTHNGIAYTVGSTWYFSFAKPTP